MHETNHAGKSCRQVGDINLAAALMACAIPLDPECPVKMIDSESLSKPYASFRVTAGSADGRHQTDSCMGHWSGTDPLYAGHPFSEICSFIACRPDGKMNADDWLDHAISYLSERGFSAPGLRSVDDIPAYVAAIPSDVSSYILAFVANRKTCLALYKSAARSVYMRRGDSHVVIDSKLPKWQRNELLSRLQG